jgi:SAM-dependent methyltransferase
MSFSADWLALREPVDHRSIVPALTEKAAAALAGLAPARIIDLGCGAGSNLRALSPALGAHQVWTLVDWDEDLLRHARERIAAWADSATQDGERLIVEKGGKRIEIETTVADLARHVERVLEKPHDLVTAAAFFDLVSEDWMAAFCAALARRGAPLYTTLTYDGREVWTPPHPREGAMLDAFHAHQRTDKGFGPAAGPDSADALTRALTAQGYAVARARSPWLLNAETDGELMGELARGAAQAVAETARASAAEIDAWLAARLAARTCEIGHADVFAAPL